jgi:hypothetical protein
MRNCSPGAQTTTRMVPHPTPTASPHLFQRVACRELGGEGLLASFRRLRFWGKINLVDHPSSHASVGWWEEKENSSYFGGGASLFLIFRFLIIPPPPLIYFAVSGGRGWGEGWAGNCPRC